MGDVSIDTQYAAIVKSHYLMPVVNGVKVTESNMHVNYRLFDELTFMDGSTNVLWTKKYNINGKYSGIYLKKILKNGKRLLVTTPYSGKDFKTEYYGEYGYEIDDFVVYDKKGIEIFKSQYNAAVTDPRMTDNGKYVYFTDSINYETNYDRCIFFNVDRKDSVYLNVPSLKFGSVEIEDDGNILLWSTTTRIRLHFDSLKVKPWKWEE
ncbi:MAG: hypothetical protein Q7W05_06605 [Deltaproteobacteria bacterium]|nr:hypothetical protein [Deltaproteobacteria bacterium]